MILLVKNRTGLKNLYEMISQSYLKVLPPQPDHTEEPAHPAPRGILVGSACGMGELYGAVMKGREQEGA